MGNVTNLRAEEAPRRSISLKDRFEVFKRDGFTCQYCARRTPAVVLEVDHVIPVAAGGGNEMENLATSCWECNRGKGASLLDHRAPVQDVTEQAILMLERERQLAEYNTVKAQVRDRENDDIAHLMDYWSEIWMHPNNLHLEVPILRGYLRKFACEDIKDAMDICPTKTGGTYSGVRYLSGILRNWEADR